MYLGIDVGGTKIGAALVDGEGQLRGKLKEPTQDTDDNAVVNQLTRIIEKFTDTAEIKGVGIGVPGIANSRTGSVWAPNIRGWENIPLAETLQAQTSLPVVIESDRNTAVLGECQYGVAQGKKDVVFLILGTGIGAGILSGGRLLRGASEIGGAVGWWPLSFRGSLLHFENVASGPAIERIARQDGHEENLPELAARIRQRDPGSNSIFDEIGSVIGQALSILVSTLNPELIVIGGGVAQSWDLMCESALEAMRRWSQPLAIQQVHVEVSRLGEDAGILGAAAAARGELL